MPKVVLLGSSGMIGSGLATYFSNTDTEVIEVNRSGISSLQQNLCLKYDAFLNPVEELLSLLPHESYIINCIGVIRHKLESQSEKSLLEAKYINSIFPHVLVKEADVLNIKIIQMGTDCIYSGSKGSYVESSIPDPNDYYGYTKRDGELKAKNLLTLRTSFIGRERKDHIEFLDWILFQERNATLKGFTNHIWNGVTPLQFGRIVTGIMRRSNFPSGTFHLIPENKTTKFELIRIITTIFSRNDLNILRWDETELVDRSLGTEFKAFNEELWNDAGYLTPPTIKEMIEEYYNWLT